MKTLYEHIQIDEENPFKISIFNKVKFNYPFHYHPGEYEITLTLGCEGYRIIGDRLEDFGDCDLALIGPGLPHGWNTYHPIHSKKAKVIVIQFNQHFFSLLLEKPFMASIKRMLELSHRGIVFHGKTRQKAMELILEMKDRQEIKEYLAILHLLYFLSLSEEYIIQCAASYTYRGNSEEKSTFDKVYKYILEHYTLPIKIKEVASLAHLSESAFSHYFKKRTLKSFSDFITELRIAHACRLMQTTEKNISEIAFESGFNNLSNFNRLFKKIKGCRPGQWKKKLTQATNK